MENIQADEVNLSWNNYRDRNYFERTSINTNDFENIFFHRHVKPWEDVNEWLAIAYVKYVTNYSCTYSATLGHFNARTSFNN